MNKVAVSVYTDIGIFATKTAKSYCVVVSDASHPETKCVYAGCDMSSQNISKKITIAELRELADTLSDYCDAHGAKRTRQDQGDGEVEINYERQQLKDAFRKSAATTSKFVKIGSISEIAQDIDSEDSK